MSEESDNATDNNGRPRRSSFVPASAGNDDFVPTLPSVGSSPIPAASDVNYFPTVETGNASIREPEPPARLVVPPRKSMTEEEIATAFAESADMSSSEQIALLDAQMTLRQDDANTAKGFFALLTTANPREAAPLLAELKAKFRDVDPEIASFELPEVVIPVVDVTPVVEPEAQPDAVPASTTVEPATDDVIAVEQSGGVEDETPSPAVSESPASEPTAASVPSDSSEVRGRYRGWSVLLGLTTFLSILVPLTFAIFTEFGSPIIELVESLRGASGVLVAVIAIATVAPLVILSRLTAVRGGLTWRVGLERVTGRVGGITLSVLTALSVLFGLFVTLVTTSQGVGIQLMSIPGVTSAMASLAPQGHITVLVVTALVALGFVIAALPRPLFRAKILALTGFTLIGPLVVILTDIAVVANSTAGTAFTAESVVVAMGVIPVVAILAVGVESGVATVLRRDENHLHGLWLYIGIALGVAFAAFVLISGMGDDLAGSIFVGSNPALHVVAPSNEFAFVIGAVCFAIPLVLLSALVGRSLMLATRRRDNENPVLWVRIVIVLLPLAVFGAEATGILGDIVPSLPGVAFVSVPLLAVLGVMSGASVASRRGLAPWAKVVNVVVTILVTALGLVLTSWAVPALSGTYDSSVAPLAASLGVTGTNALVVPAAVLVVTFLVSLITSSVGAVRSVSQD